jgi:Ca2+-binding EF-hand superfamily protein
MEAVLKDGMGRRFRRHGHGGMTGKRIEHAFDANHDGKITKDEVRAEFERRFAAADINSDGKIDDADLPPWMRGRNAIGDDSAGARRGGRHGMRRELRFLRAADTNKDGVVTRDEVAAQADQRFARLDWNKDGTVDQADRDALRKESVDYAVKRMAHRMGAGPDGKVTREQFLAKAGERFARLDVDNDGKVTRKELPGRGHGMRWHHRHGDHGMGNHGDDADGMQGKGGAPAPGEAGEPPAKN